MDLEWEMLVLQVQPRTAAWLRLLWSERCAALLRLGLQAVTSILHCLKGVALVISRSVSMH